MRMQNNQQVGLLATYILLSQMISEATRLKSKVFSLVSFWSPPPSLRQRVKYDGWDRETGVGGPFLNLGVA